MKKLSILIALLLMISLTTSVAYAEEKDEDEKKEELKTETAQWISVVGIEGGQILFDSETGKVKDVENSVTKAHFPERIEGVEVKYLNSSIFYKNENIVSVVIPGTVESVEPGSFAHCPNLTTVVIQEGVEEIKYSAFYNCQSLTSLTLPNSLEDIGNSAFGLTGLVEVEIPEGVEELGDGVFYGSKKLKAVYIPSTLEEMGDNVFWQCHLLSDVYYNGTADMWNEIEIGTDSGELMSATLHQSNGETFVPSLGANSEMGWVAVDGIVGGQILFDSDKGIILEVQGEITQAHIPSEINGTTVEYLSSSLFSKSDELTSVIIPGTIKKIPMDAFANCDELEIVTIEEGVEEIAISAFYGCEDLETLSLPKSLRTIGNTVFGLTGLEKVTIPEGVETIGEMAFYGSKDIEEVYIPSTVKSIGNKVFWQCNELEDVYYNGSENGWENIGIGSDNKELFRAKIHMTDGTIFETNPDENAGNPSNWADKEIDKAKEKGLVIVMTGLPQYKDDITREQFAESIVNTVEIATGKEISIKENPFKDTDNIDIIKAYSAGIVTGMTEDTFGPEKEISREQIAVMLYRAMLYIAENGGATILTIEDGDISMYDDSDDVSDWAEDAVSALNANGIMKGASASNLSPKKTTSVEQSILLLNRLVESIHE